MIGVGMSSVFWLESFLLNGAPDFLRYGSLCGTVGLLVISFVKHMIRMGNTGPTPDLNVITESGTFRKGTVSWVACGMRGWRPAMEDAHVATALDPAVFADAVLFAVLDGHGGAEVSALASKLLKHEVESCGRKLLAESRKISEKAPRTDAALLGEALSMALPNLDAKLRRGIGHVASMLPNFLHPFFHTGCTAIVVGVDFKSRHVMAANIGDSRAMLVRKGKCLPLSEDHKPEDPIERKRIEAAGGQVVRVGPCHRVDGNLNLSRALGDFHLKGNDSVPACEQKVSAYPDNTRASFSGGEDEVLVICCDGLFEKCSNQEVALIVWQRLTRGYTLEKTGEELLRECCARGTTAPREFGTDNETCIIVRLPPLLDSNEDASDNVDLILEAGTQVTLHDLENEADCGFEDGMDVIAVGLQGATYLNGMDGKILEWVADKERYAVKFSNGETKQVKADNLKKQAGPNLNGQDGILVEPSPIGDASEPRWKVALPKLGKIIPFKVSNLRVAAGQDASANST